MQALRLYAGPAALNHIKQQGLLPQHVGAIPAAAGGPKGLILGPIDRFVFGEWLRGSEQQVHLIGASIGAWRMATACLDDNVPALEQLERNYIAQHFELPPGQKRPTATQVSGQFRHNLQVFYGGRVDQVLNHPRYRLHIVTSRGRGVLARDGRMRTPLGYVGAFAANAVHRRALGGWLDRVVFSSDPPVGPSVLPFDTDDFRSHQVRLSSRNFMDALQASCSIPFVLRPVHDIEGAPKGAYWDGGITDYHLHLRYRLPATSPLVLYPHFQRSVVPGWLDKAWKRRHAATSALDHMLVLAPDLEWIRRLPEGRLPDRSDFTRYGQDLAGRMRVWTRSTSAARQLADEFAEWLHKPDLDRLEPL
ncbi:patatin-like phospholipase family protein [Hydrogenophaga sp. PAMC20947]|uniref:patatin-like phospholipase family protein n=1 Tax=Hydrogenophaga sp. PAMC20947 TaxID=2565558 RepID=UPI00109E172E|nr:patatin-like phospholipase family protein [Hydrogenophaga sp. PAMC20947]QCB46461.1 phospholipase [Hydrogenophaga sp. PAMC20947]